MVKWAVTGAEGFLAWHLRCRLHVEHPDIAVAPIDRQTFGDDDALDRAIGDADVVVHLAAVNSHDPVANEDNARITERLIAALDRSGADPHIVIPNSTHAERDSAYGNAKRAVVERIRDWAGPVDASVSDVMLPGLFGERGRPNYNSVIATMCDSIVNGRAMLIDPDGSTELLHAQDAVRELIAAGIAHTDSHERVAGIVVSVPETHERIAAMHVTYTTSDDIPILGDRFGVRLFNQLRFAMFPTARPAPLRSGTDPRGTYAEIARTWEPSQVSASTTVPGATRGEHLHFHKIERFAIISGRARIEMRRLLDDRIHTFEFDGSSPAIIDIPTLYTHNLINIGESELITVFWTNDHFDPQNADTWREPVHPGNVAS